MDITKMTNNEIVDYLEDKRNCSLILWQPQDAISVAKNSWGVTLTEDQAIEIMAGVTEQADDTLGIDWDTLFLEVRDYLINNNLIN